MARYTTSVSTARSAADAFAFMADLRHFATWDPGVTGVTQVSGDGGGADAVFDVVVKGVPKDITLRYVTKEYAPPTGSTKGSLLVVAKSRMLTSIDRVTVAPTETGCHVTYDAELLLNGPLKLLDPLLGLSFKKIGDRAAAGLVAALAGTKV
jgi:hypothetical protein